MAKSHVSGTLYSTGGFVAGQDPNALSNLSTTTSTPYAFFVESSQDGIAATGSTQATAFQITTQTARISTATAGSAFGVALPPSQPGLELAIINDSSVGVQLYSYVGGSDTLNDTAGSTGITLMPNSMVIASSAYTGKWYITGIGTGFSPSGVNIETASYTANITAVAGGQGSATPLTTQINQVSTNPASGGVLLPVAKPGLSIQVSNYTATNALTVYGNGTDTIAVGGVSPAASTSVPTYKTISLWCASTGAWHGVVA